MTRIEKLSLGRTFGKPKYKPLFIISRIPYDDEYQKPLQLGYCLKQSCSVCDRTAIIFRDRESVELNLELGLCQKCQDQD